MDVIFQHRQFGELCDDQRRLKKELGDQQAKKLIMRLEALKAVRNLAEMRTLPGRCHGLIGDRWGQFSLDLVHPYRLIFVPNHDPIPVKAHDGGIDWGMVTAVCIIEVVDTHE